MQNLIFQDILRSFELVGYNEVLAFGLLVILVNVGLVFKFQISSKSLVKNFLINFGYLTFTALLIGRNINNNWDLNRDILLQIVPAISVALQAADHEKLDLKTDANNSTYLKIIEIEKNLLKIYPLISDVYTIRRIDGKNYFIVDSETDYNRNGIFDGDREARTAIGEEYTNLELDQVIQDAALGQVSFVKRPYTDKWGFWVSSMSPLFDASGKIDAVIGIDYPADVLIAKIKSEYRILLLVFLVVYLFGIYIYVTLQIIRNKNNKAISALNDKLELSKALEVEQGKSISSAKMAALGEMASGIAHEINNPLAIIKGLASAIKRRVVADAGDKKEEILNKIDSIIVTTDRIAKIIKGLRAFSRNADNDPVEPSSLLRILDDTLSICRERFKNSGFELRLNDLQDIQFLARPTQVSQVFLNLLNNSFDATRELSERWIEIKTQVINETKFIVTVTDSGPGIPDELLDQIMNPFFTTKEVGKGTGLGLSISKGIMESNGGKLYYNKESKHTSFILEFNTKLPEK